MSGNANSGRWGLPAAEGSAFAPQPPQLSAVCMKDKHYPTRCKRIHCTCACHVRHETEWAEGKAHSHRVIVKGVKKQELICREAA